ncbi:MBL fold metallo-hydrolase [Pontibacter akesuensis]|uniref:Glyoxylase, beta-lactamase superfamily II n=1 Tax=Pontibacter akesuensis TaxID=388950 RepID=A0A1I7KQ22_9BACT|nr:rhodanese-like domain-containing protein [Pontibacter akesuensis]GHA81495.1 MBL fold metallo-hydrolase [Pontibacter akesuensis]SFU99543.1 Glyoxylase, beta-lactamase superfamily II [Pontibacter akesuensis]
MKIKQFEDKGLAHYAYAILSENAKEVILIDPARDPQPYYDYAAEHDANIVGVIETHPHADFVSSHLEIHLKTGATIYTHSLVGADYPHKAFDEGAALQLGEVKLKSLHTPGHSPDSISVVLEHEGKDKAVFTGDTLFIGDVGRPDLRESAGNVTAKREELARQMYHSTREKLMQLADDVVVYPAHGAGSLCGKGLSDANSSTIGDEKLGNYALKPMSEDAFVKVLTEDQPFIPKYFGYDVDLNKQGAPDYTPSVEGVARLERNFQPEDGAVIVDARSEKVFKQGHYKGAINIQNGGKFETWLGSIVGPSESYYLVGESDAQLNELIAKASKIGYELLLKGAFVYDRQEGEQSDNFDRSSFEENKEDYTVLDIRNESEVKSGKFFESSINIPLPELRERAKEIPTDKPVVVHCAGGYRSAAGSSIVASALPDVKVLDMSEAVTELKNK